MGAEPIDKFGMRPSDYRYYVYVISLDSKIRSDDEFVQRNPRMLPDKECFYVGQSFHEPECRFRQHTERVTKGVLFVCNCYLASNRGALKRRFPCPKARKYGRELRWELFEGRNPMGSRKEAVRQEEALAKELQAQGHGVWWGEEQRRDLEKGSRHEPAQLSQSPDDRKYCVYVISLDPRVRKDKAFRASNPRMSETGRCLFVGLSVHEPECRRDQHAASLGTKELFICRCYMAPLARKPHQSPQVREYAMELCPDFYNGLSPTEALMDGQNQADQLERRLREDGHGVLRDLDLERAERDDM